MIETTSDLIQAALNLPETQRVQIVDALLESLSPDSAEPLNASWLAEIERRSNAIDEGSDTTVPWDEIRTRTRQRLGLESADVGVWRDVRLRPGNGILCGEKSRRRKSLRCS